MLAIVIPYYKLLFFEKTLDSLSRQTDNRFKVYIGDDASPDDVRPLLEKFKNKINYSYYRFEDNVGKSSLVKQWQRCINLVEDAEWLMLLGDDDLLENNCIEAFYQHHEEVMLQNIKLIRFATYKINEHSEVVSDAYVHPVLENVTKFLVRKFEGKTRSSLSEYIFSMENVIKRKFVEFPLAWHSDVFAVLEFSDFGPVFSINEAKVHIRISPVSISGMTTNLVQKKKADAAFYSRLIDHLRVFEPKDQVKVLSHAEKFYIYNKKEIFLGLKIMLVYVFNFDGWALINFIRRILISFDEKYYAFRK
ncbi:MAG TPA: glycosyltransferase [Flavobacterium sp.]